jgi:hypothetical protein
VRLVVVCNTLAVPLTLWLGVRLGGTTEPEPPLPAGLAGREAWVEDGMEEASLDQQWCSLEELWTSALTTRAELSLSSARKTCVRRDCTSRHVKASRLVWDGVCGWIGQYARVW